MHEPQELGLCVFVVKPSPLHSLFASQAAPLGRRRRIPAKRKATPSQGRRRCSEGSPMARAARSAYAFPHKQQAPPEVEAAGLAGYKEGARSAFAPPARRARHVSLL